MQVSVKVEEYTFDQFRVDLHKFCNFIPIISTLTNLVAVIEKRFYVPDTDTEFDHIDSRYYTYLKAQDFKKDWLLFIPIANTIFSILRCCSQEVSISYRPSFSSIIPYKAGRYEPRYLLEISENGKGST